MVMCHKGLVYYLSFTTSQPNTKNRNAVLATINRQVRDPPPRGKQAKTPTEHDVSYGHQNHTPLQRNGMATIPKKRKIVCWLCEEITLFAKPIDPMVKLGFMFMTA